MSDQLSNPRSSNSEPFDASYAQTASTSEEALELARAWANGRRSWCNLGPHEPYTPDVIAAMDAQEVVRWGALARTLREAGL